MSHTIETKRSEKSGLGWKLTLVICCLVLLLGAGATVLIFSTEPTATRTTATKKTAMLVDVTGVERGTYQPTILVMGTVEPEQDIILRPRVSGEILSISKNFTPGGFAEKGDVLLKIDPADYRNRLRQLKSGLEQARAELDLEMGRQKVARRDYQLLDESLSAPNKGLVLRKPQLKGTRARVEAARAAVEQAELELERTAVKAPFEAQVVRRTVNMGSQVSAGDPLGRLVGVKTYWVAATVPVSKLRWLSFPSAAGGKGSKAVIRDRSAWDVGQYRTGRLFKLVGVLEDQTRMARVLVAVDDPLGRSSGSPSVPYLMLGAFVEVSIKGREIADVIRLNRDLVRQNDTVWVMQDGKLDIRETEIVFKDPEYAYISQGLNEQDRVVTTNLTTVVQGAGLRLKKTGNHSGGK